MKISAAEIKNKIRENKILYLIILGSFLLSIAYSFYFRIKPAVDAKAYDKIAINIVAGHGFREELSGDIANDAAITRVGPLYEYFLAGLYAIFDHNYEAVWIAQALLRALSVWLIYLIACLIFADSPRRKKIALMAAGIFGFYPDLVEISAMLLIETLYLFLLCLALFLFFRYSARQTWTTLILMALITGLAILARPPIALFVPVMLFYLLRRPAADIAFALSRSPKGTGMQHRQGLLAKRPAAISATGRSLVFLIILAAVFVPWAVRNYAVYREFMPLGAAGNFNFWIGNYHGGRGEQEPNQEQFEFENTHPIKDINAESMRQFKLFLREHPGEFVKLTVLRVNKYFSFIRPIGFWFYQTGLGQMLMVFSSATASVFLFIFGFGGFWEAVRQKNEKLLYLAAFVVATPLIIFITVVETRYRFQIYPLLAILAGYFASKLWVEKKWWANKVFLTVAAIFFSNAIVDLFLSMDRLKERFGQFF